MSTWFLVCYLNDELAITCAQRFDNLTEAEAYMKAANKASAATTA